MSNEVEIRVRSKDDSAPGFKSAEKNANGLKGTLDKVGKAAAGFLLANVAMAAAAKVKEFVGGSVEAYSNLNESLNAVNKIFGKSQQTILDWGKNNANAYGLSQRAFNDLAVPLGAGLKNMGFSQDVAAQKTVELTKRAADMASVFNTTVPEALEAIQAGLRGEADPLERFGVGLSAAAVEAEALAETGKKSAKALTDQEKATARVNLIMKQTSATAGDFVGTSDGLANSQRIAAAKSEELAAKIGQRLAPAVAGLVTLKLKLMDVVANKVLPAFIAFGGWIEKNQTLIIILAAAIGGVLVTAFLSWAAAAAAAGVATLVAAAPMIALGAAVGLLALGFIKLWNTSEKFRSIVLNVLMAIGVAILTMVQIGLHGFDIFLGAFLTMGQGIAHGAAKAFGWIPGLGDKLQKSADDFDKYKEGIQGALDSAIKKTAEYKDAVQSMPRNIKLKSDIRDLTDKINTAKAKLKSVPASRQAAIRANIAQLSAQVARARAKLAGIKDRYVNVYVSEVHRDAQRSRGVGRIGGYAHGGVVGSAATGGVRGGLIEVGEYGRELVRLPYGSTVYPKGTSDRMMAGSGGGGASRVVLEIRAGASRLDAFLLELLRKSIRVQGGDVQLVLGS